MKQFQHLMRATLLSGAIAGAMLFLFQYFVIVPRIIAAEDYELPSAMDCVNYAIILE